MALFGSFCFTSRYPSFFLWLSLRRHSWFTSVVLAFHVGHSSVFLGVFWFLTSVLLGVRCCCVSAASSCLILYHRLGFVFSGPFFRNILSFFFLFLLDALPVCLSSVRLLPVSFYPLLPVPRFHRPHRPTHSFYRAVFGLVWIILNFLFVPHQTDFLTRLYQ